MWLWASIFASLSLSLLIYESRWENTLFGKNWIFMHSPTFPSQLSCVGVVWLFLASVRKWYLHFQDKTPKSPNIFKLMCAQQSPGVGTWMVGWISWWRRDWCSRMIGKDWDGLWIWSLASTFPVSDRAVRCKRAHMWELILISLIRCGEWQVNDVDRLD